MSEKYTGLNNWYAAEQTKWELSDERKEQLRERRKRRIAEDAMRLADMRLGTSVSEQPQPVVTTPEAPQTPPDSPTSTKEATPTPDVLSTQEKYHLPAAFKTEKGSLYTYSPDGHAKRLKYDNSEHDPTGITVFIEGTDENLDVITRDGIDQSETAPEEHQRSYIIEAEGGGTWHKVYDINDVQNPDKLAFARITGNDTITALAPASLQPFIGAHVYEITKLEDGSTSRHPGHKVSEVMDATSKTDSIGERPHPRVATFEAAHQLPGNSIDDILAAIDADGIDLDGLEGGDPFDKYEHKRFRRKISNEEVDFFRMKAPKNLADYDAELIKFSNKLVRENPYPDKRKVTTNHIGWLQHSSKAFIKNRVENKSHDHPTARIYLTPKFGMEMIQIYEEVFTKAEQAGLKFKAKVYDPTIRGKAERIEKFKNFFNVEYQRTDPMVFYPFEESKDALLQIVNEVYDMHADAFEGTHTGAIPVEIAPGFAVGSEPKGLTGKESLTSHRRILGGAFNMARRHPQWSTASRATKLTICRAYLQKVAEVNTIDPNNIAFDAR